MVVSTNIEVQGPNAKTTAKKGGKEPPPKAKGHKDEPVDSSTVCEFCDKNDREFRDSNKHDIHLWREC